MNMRVRSMPAKDPLTHRLHLRLPKSSAVSGKGLSHGFVQSGNKWSNQPVFLTASAQHGVRLALGELHRPGMRQRRSHLDFPLRYCFKDAEHRWSNVGTPHID
jgi:hypothetical protein